MELLIDVVRLCLLAVPVAWLAWTVTKEEVFREFREFCADRSKKGSALAIRKFFYLFTCEYCFSHWCALGLQFVYQFQLVFSDWRGYLVAYAGLVAVANTYMSLYQRLRVDIRKERATADKTELDVGRKRAA